MSTSKNDLGYASEPVSSYPQILRHSILVSQFRESQPFYR